MTVELVEVLGHELLNGLAPIASLSESPSTSWTARATTRLCCARSWGFWRAGLTASSGSSRPIAHSPACPSRSGVPRLYTR